MNFIPYSFIVVFKHAKITFRHRVFVRPWRYLLFAVSTVRNEETIVSNYYISAMLYFRCSDVFSLYCSDVFSNKTSKNEAHSQQSISSRLADAEILEGILERALLLLVVRARGQVDMHIAICQQHAAIVPLKNNVSLTLGGDSKEVISLARHHQ